MSNKRDTGKTDPKKNKHTVAGLDIGTNKVAMIIATVGPDGLEVAGVGSTAHAGVRHGVVVNIEATSDAILKAKEEAELMSGLTIQSVWLGVAGTHIESFDSSGMVAVRHEEVTHEDIRRVIEAARAVAIPADRQVLHVLPTEYRIDGQPGISDPIGMSGVRLESSVHIVTANHAAVQNALKCLDRAGVKLEGLVLQQLASSLAVLSEDEKNLGVAVVDMGGGTCDLIVYDQGRVVDVGVIPVGGQNFTHDVSMGLRTTQVDAEALKKKHGCALRSMVDADEFIEVEGVGGRQSRTIARTNLCQVLEARAEETFELIRNRLKDKKRLTQLGSGIVLTGGASQLQGLVELGDFVLDVPVRLGLPVKVGGLTDVVRSPSYATAVGLLLYGWQQEKQKQQVEQDIGRQPGFAAWARRFRGIFVRPV